VHGVQAVAQLRIVTREQMAVAVQVNATEVCPARTLTSLGLAPAAIHRATAVCRRSEDARPLACPTPSRKRSTNQPGT
jgi:hypothetical protein